MKKTVLYSVMIVCGFLGCGLIGACSSSHGNPQDKWDTEMTPQEFFDYEITKSEVTDSAGHTLILYETGRRGSRFYSFSIDHSTECKKCYAAFD